MKKEIGYIYVQVLFLGKSSHIRFCNVLYVILSQHVSF